ncbi:hypothetical protein [Asticcacaulis sp. EMRT-3]|uniref:hypothetical protein n=1 Tax=Asticcacaulis sp. EMRT-3 TaxID=3040349 RepID=UPI0024AF2175|nr:hypothetical protein [Asticcacaulis sp. EMRT-3]MDI7774243.1 hypothetical protein [Asticcacaulis sp. EMRT-3]
MEFLIAKTVILFAAAFFVPALIGFLLTPARRKPVRAMARPMLFDDEPEKQAEDQPETLVKVAEPPPEAQADTRPARPEPVSYLDAAAEAFTAGVVTPPGAPRAARPADLGPYTPLPVSGGQAAAASRSVANVTIHRRDTSLQRRVSSLAVMTPDSIEAAVQQAGSGLEPLRLDGPEGAPDDLTVISGISPSYQGELNALGIYHYWQVSGWGPEEVAWVANRIRPAQRIARENWMAQAARLAKL